MTELDERALSVTKFWRDAGPDAWFDQGRTPSMPNFRSRFLDLHYAAARRELRRLGRRMPRARWR